MRRKLIISLVGIMVVAYGAIILTIVTDSKPFPFADLHVKPIQGLEGVKAATVKIDGAGRLLPARLDDIEAVQGVAPGSLLYLRSPLPPGTPVRLLSPLPRGLLGLAEYGDPSAPMRCAVLATCALQAGAVPCMPIQNATPGRLYRALEHQGFSLLEAQGILPLLQELPLLVPVAAPRPTSATTLSPLAVPANAQKSALPLPALGKVPGPAPVGAPKPGAFPKPAGAVPAPTAAPAKGNIFSKFLKK